MKKITNISLDKFHYMKFQLLLTVRPRFGRLDKKVNA